MAVFIGKFLPVAFWLVLWFGKTSALPHSPMRFAASSAYNNRMQLGGQRSPSSKPRPAMYPVSQVSQSSGSGVSDFVVTQPRDNMYFSLPSTWFLPYGNRGESSDIISPSFGMPYDDSDDDLMGGDGNLQRQTRIAPPPSMFHSRPYSSSRLSAAKIVDEKPEDSREDDYQNQYSFFKLMG
ncbi:hypothetical protein RvY_10208 [Ramazzottius varieornatus]|uniref:Uncharacterized protein n=1 Tax=Ramazzottius varieornatus TaxID=947166 RepID=A0A1D1VGI6_RAMVA|nr:hypothetical protein RvY_10208 [Ramazzottius varieornatus]